MSKLTDISIPILQEMHITKNNASIILGRLSKGDEVLKKETLKDLHEEEKKITEKRNTETKWKSDQGSALQTPEEDPNTLVSEEILKKIPDLVSFRLSQVGTSIDDIEKKRNKTIPGTPEQGKFRKLPVWHNKRDMDEFVQKKLKLSDEQMKATFPKGGEIVYIAVAHKISDLRKKGILVDWSPIDDYRTGIWRLTEMDEKHVPDFDRDSKLELPSAEKLIEIKEKIRKKLLVDDTVIEKIIASLYSGKHVLLTGPVGTGKTDLAKTLPQIVWNYYPEIHTATADWTTQDVIGGLYPKIENEQMKFQIQRGCVSSTVAKNWSDETGQNGTRVTFTKNDSEGIPHEYEGVWLVIDEFNRANIDRAFGQLFTALEYRNELKVPTVKTSSENNSEEFERYLIPSDYRIIGTLNTYDKHFLFHLSDALKRRFDFIEVSIPERKDYEKEFEIVKEKAADSELLQQELETLLKENPETKTHLIEIFAFVRKIKQLGTAILISILRDLLIYHKMGKKWDESLDSGLVKKVIPQLESVSTTSLKILYKFAEGSLGDFFIKFPVDEHPEKITDFKNELEKFEKYFRERFQKEFSEDWITKFENGELNKLRNNENLSDQQKQQVQKIQSELNPWGPNIPDLKNFKKSIANLIQENELSTIGNLESEFN